MSKCENGRNGSPPFAVGATVRLTQKYAACLNRSKRSQRAHWEERTGTVTRCNDYDAWVMWSGRKGSDCTPVRAIELVAAKKDPAGLRAQPGQVGRSPRPEEGGAVPAARVGRPSARAPVAQARFDSIG